ncbi:MAG: hypothetical protein KatS3mg090_0461 [Patescibacteria group bacterium]|nr:MAG: hypothetical protein KatS3mg090_0461 [Patescibacteria group bacterium]
MKENKDLPLIYYNPGSGFGRAKKLASNLYGSNPENYCGIYSLPYPVNLLPGNQIVLVGGDETAARFLAYLAQRGKNVWVVPMPGGQENVIPRSLGVSGATDPIAVLSQTEDFTPITIGKIQGPNNHNYFVWYSEFSVFDALGSCVLAQIEKIRNLGNREPSLDIALRKLARVIAGILGCKDYLKKTLGSGFDYLDIVYSYPENTFYKHLRALGLTVLLPPFFAYGKMNLSGNPNDINLLIHEYKETESLQDPRIGQIFQALMYIIDMGFSQAFSRLFAPFGTICKVSIPVGGQVDISNSNLKCNRDSIPHSISHSGPVSLTFKSANVFVPKLR